VSGSPVGARLNHEHMVSETYLDGDGKDERYDKHCLGLHFALQEYVVTVL